MLFMLINFVSVLEKESCQTKRKLFTQVIFNFKNVILEVANHWDEVFMR